MLLRNGIHVLAFFAPENCNMPSAPVGQMEGYKFAKLYTAGKGPFLQVFIAQQYLACNYVRNSAHDTEEIYENIDCSYPNYY